MGRHLPGRFSDFRTECTSTSTCLTGLADLHALTWPPPPLPPRPYRTISCLVAKPVTFVVHPSKKCFVRISSILLPNVVPVARPDRREKENQTESLKYANVASNGKRPRSFFLSFAIWAPVSSQHVVVASFHFLHLAVCFSRYATPLCRDHRDPGRGRLGTVHSCFPKRTTGRAVVIADFVLRTSRASAVCEKPPHASSQQQVLESISMNSNL